MFVGYVDAVLTAAAFDENGFFRTGDIGHLDADGYVVITGRLKDVIIRKGENISAKEVEDYSYEHPKVAMSLSSDYPTTSGASGCALWSRACPGSNLSRLTRCAAHLLECELITRKLPEQLEHRRRAAPQRGRQSAEARATGPLLQVTGRHS